MASVRYWAAARDVAGAASEQVEGDFLRVVLNRACERHGSDLARLVAVSVILIDGVKVSADSDRRVAEETVIEILPPYAGG